MGKLKCYKLGLLGGGGQRGRAVWVEACSKLVVAGKDFYECRARGSVQSQYYMLSPPKAPQI